MHDTCTVNVAYNDTRRGIAKCPYSRSVVIPEVSLLCVTVGWDFALGMEILSLFANCRYIRSRYSRIVVISAVVSSEVDCTCHVHCVFLIGFPMLGGRRIGRVPCSNKRAVELCGSGVWTL